MTADISPTTILQITLADLRTIVNEIREEARREAEEADRYLTRTDAAVMLGVTPTTIDNWVKTGLLTAYKVGSRTRFRASDIHNLKSTKKA